MARTYENKNAAAVLARVQEHIVRLEQAQKDHQLQIGMQWKGYGWTPVYRINSVYEELSIFDWWNDTLSVSQLKQMEKFLSTAIKLGYTGYVCFKVGAAGCAHGMWAYKNETETGYSPDGETLWRGFKNGSYNEWDACLADETWLHDIVTEVDTFTLKDVKNMLNSVEV